MYDTTTTNKFNFGSEDGSRFEDFSFWFTLNQESVDWKINIHDISADHHVIGYIVFDGEQYVYDINQFDEEKVRHDFGKFKTVRPEWSVIGHTKQIGETDIISYVCLLSGSYLLSEYKNGNNPDDSVRYINACIDWLNSTDFFTAPASTRFHNAYPSGLLEHTLHVIENIESLIKLDKFRSVHIEDAVLSACVHDWCKIGRYEQYMKNVKDDNTGVWHKEPAYRYKKDGLISLGHGVSSMFLASRFFRLTLHQSYAIRWHMGEYNVADNEMNELHWANENVPMVQLLQFADRLSITKY